MNEMPRLKSRNVRDAIKEIENLDLATCADAEIEESIGKLINGYQVRAPIFREGLDIYRARLFAQKPGNISELGPPPTSLVTSYGRGNTVGESVFYSTNSKGVPFYELKCSPGDRVVISKWRTSPNLVLNHVGFTEETKERLSSGRDLDDIYSFVRDTNNYSELNEMVHEYLGVLFSQPVLPEAQETTYRLTSAIARKLTQGNVIHGVIYPTIQMSGNADNVLLKKAYFDNYVDFVHAEFIEVDQLNSARYSGTVLDSVSSINETGTLVWAPSSLGAC